MARFRSDDVVNSRAITIEVQPPVTGLMAEHLQTGTTAPADPVADFLVDGTAAAAFGLLLPQTVDD